MTSADLAVDEDLQSLAFTSVDSCRYLIDDIARNSYIQRAKTLPACHQGSFQAQIQEIERLRMFGNMPAAHTAAMAMESPHLVGLDAACLYNQMAINFVTSGDRNEALRVASLSFAETYFVEYSGESISMEVSPCIYAPVGETVERDQAYFGRHFGHLSVEQRDIVADSKILFAETLLKVICHVAKTLDAHDEALSAWLESRLEAGFSAGNNSRQRLLAFSLMQAIIDVESSDKELVKGSRFKRLIQHEVFKAFMIPKKGSPAQLRSIIGLADLNKYTKDGGLDHQIAILSGMLEQQMSDQARKEGILALVQHKLATSSWLRAWANIQRSNTPVDQIRNRIGIGEYISDDLRRFWSLTKASLQEYRKQNFSDCTTLLADIHHNFGTFCMIWELHGCALDHQHRRFTIYQKLQAEGEETAGCISAIGNDLVRAGFESMGKLYLDKASKMFRRISPDHATSIARSASESASSSRSRIKSKIRIQRYCCNVLCAERESLTPFRKCANCKVSVYCSVACQKTAWKLHKNACKEWSCNALLKS